MTRLEARKILLEAENSLDLAWNKAPALSSRRRNLSRMIRTVDIELADLDTKILADGERAYKPLIGNLSKSIKDLKWARNKVESFEIAVKEAEKLVVWATKMIAIL